MAFFVPKRENLIVHAAAHEQLLVDLRALGQAEAGTVRSGWHQELDGTPRRECASVGVQSSPRIG
jgi:hypothetical protein